MSTFEEIEAAVARLSDEEAMVLMAKLMRRLHDPDAEPPEPREFTAEQMQQWIDLGRGGDGRVLGIDRRRRLTRTSGPPKARSRRPGLSLISDAASSSTAACASRPAGSGVGASAATVALGGGFRLGARRRAVRPR